MQNIITLITLNPQNALILQKNLMEHNIEVTLEPVTLPGSSDVIGIRVNIPVGAVPVGIKMVEEGLLNGKIRQSIKKIGGEGGVLIPVDFTDSSINAVKVGFELADRVGVRPLIIHAIGDEMVGGFMKRLKADRISNRKLFIPDNRMAVDINRQADISMQAFSIRIKDRQKNKMLPDIDFSTKIVNSIPEEAILDYCKENKPVCVVMATRSNQHSETNLIGSITAEVIDSCRYPVLTVPDNYEEFDIGKVKRIALFCNLDQHDIITVDALISMSDYSGVEVYLIPVDDRGISGLENRLAALTNYLEHSYDQIKFYPYIVNNNKFREEFDNFVNEKDIQLLIIPNKKTNVFSRIFRPTLAHRFLFERNMPMLILPV